MSDAPTPSASAQPEGLRQAIERYWDHHSTCMTIDWLSRLEAGILRCEASPAFQEILGGPEDGAHKWAGFHFDLTEFAKEPGIEIEKIILESYCCVECNDTPSVNIRGLFYQQPFWLRLRQEPVIGSEPLEFVDSNTNEVRPIQEKP